MGQKRGGKEVEELLRRYEAREGVSRRDFCKNEGVGLSTLGYYLRRRRIPQVRLAQVKISRDIGADKERFALVLGNGRRIECEAAGLTALIAAAEQA